MTDNRPSAAPVDNQAQIDAEQTRLFQQAHQLQLDREYEWQMTLEREEWTEAFPEIEQPEERAI